MDTYSLPAWLPDTGISFVGKGRGVPASRVNHMSGKPQGRSAKMMDHDATTIRSVKIMDFKSTIQHTFSELSVAVLTIIIPFCWILYALFLHPLARIPGPFLASVSPIWKLQRAIKGTLHRDILNGHEKYGGIVRVAPNEVSIADPEEIKMIYVLNAGFNKVRIFCQGGDHQSSFYPV